VTLDLNCLLDEHSGEIDGWFPIFHTHRGVRGHLHLSVKLAFFGDANPLKMSAAGVPFFACACAARVSASCAGAR
jgi:hypothetical protein